MKFEFYEIACPKLHINIVSKRDEEYNNDGSVYCKTCKRWFTEEEDFISPANTY